MFQIKLAGQLQPLKSIFCIGRNYSEHISELANSRPKEPLIFMKPTQSVLYSGQPILFPEFSQNIHYECEIVIYIARSAENVVPAEALQHIGGVGIGLDLTARDTQNELKSQGYPWLKAKGFKGATCLSEFVAAKDIHDFNNIEFNLTLNQQKVQAASSKEMIYSIPEQIVYLSKVYGLQAGDLIFTGTPKGVGALKHGDKLTARLANLLSANWEVA